MCFLWTQINDSPVHVPEEVTVAATRLEETKLQLRNLILVKAIRYFRISNKQSWI